MTFVTDVATIWVNGRFLARPITGVERVAHETLRELALDIERSGGAWIFQGRKYTLCLIAPSVDDRAIVQRCAVELGLPVQFCGTRTGHAWEQIELPRFVRGAWLLNLCNTAPVLKRNQWVFIHDAGVWAIPQFYTWTFRVWYRTMFWLLIRQGVGILTNSNFSAGELAKHLHLPLTMIQVAQLGADHSCRTPVDAHALAGITLPQEPFLLAVSSQNPNKNFSAIAEALRLLGASAPPCVIVGQPRSDIFAAGSQNAAHLHFCGYVSDDALKALLDRALCLIYPSFYEGFGLPPLEAMSRGCPVITSSTSALPETCGDAALYCDPANPKSLADAISTVANDPSRRASMRAMGLERAVTFQWAHTAASVKRAIESRL